MVDLSQTAIFFLLCFFSITVFPMQTAQKILTVLKGKVILMVMVRFTFIIHTYIQHIIQT